LDRISIETTASVAMGLYDIGITGGAGHYDPIDWNEADERENAWVAVNRSCKGAENFSIDMNNPLLGAQNSATTIGAIDSCARLNENNVIDADEDPVDLDGNGLPEADTVIIDVTANNIPASNPMAGFTLTVSFPSETSLVFASGNYMLTSGAGSSLYSVDDPLPEADGRWTANAVDLNTGLTDNDAETGSGIVERLYLQSSGNASGVHPVTLVTAAHVDVNNELFSPEFIYNGMLALNTACPGEPALPVVPPPGVVPELLTLEEDTTASSASSDPDTDGDAHPDSVEQNCGSDPLSQTSTPERIDGKYAGADEDADSQVDEPLPSGSIGFDCDGDGFIGATENHIYAPNARGDQDPCGTNNSPPTVPPAPIGWPADLKAGGSYSVNRVNISDLASFVAPIRYMNTDVGTRPGDVRWDLAPGSTFGKDINVQDLAALISGGSGHPRMLNGARAFNGPYCPEAIDTHARQASYSNPPLTTTSHYINDLTGDCTNDYWTNQARGADQGRLGQLGALVLDFGGQVYNAGQWGILDWNGEFHSENTVVCAVQGFIDGFWHFSAYSQYMAIAIGTNNSLTTDYLSGYTWAGLVNRFADYLRVTGFDVQLRVRGANDIEPSFGAATNSSSWAGGYSSRAIRSYYHYGTADGCPASGTGPYTNASCNNGWLQSDVMYTAWGNIKAWPLPEIYLTDGTNAWQWQQLSAYAHHHSGWGSMDWVGAMTQLYACHQRSCHPSTMNHPVEGWRQLQSASDSEWRTWGREVSYSTDIRWQPY
jgi:hypothetical protein